jgi:PAS domain S-box-containing protein
MRIVMSDSDAETTGTDAQFRMLVQAITDYAIYRLDPTGTVASWNGGAERANGYSTLEIVGQNFAIFFTPEDQAAGKPAQALATARSAGRFEDEGWQVRKNGTRFWASVFIDSIIDENGRHVGFAKVTRDLTERRIAQGALRKSEEHHRLLMESVVDYAIYTLDPEGLVTSWNSGAERAKGYTRDEIIGQNYSRFFPPEDQAAGKPARLLAAAREIRQFGEEGWRVRKNGTQFWASVVIESMWSEDKRLVGFVKVTRDITDKLLLEKAKARLYEAQKMEMIERFSGGVAHDFNNLLSVVMGSVELISTLTDDVGIQRLAQTAHKAADRGAKLTYQLLAYSRQQILQPRVSDINELTKGFENLLKHACGEPIHLLLNLSSNLWSSEIDQIQFQSALLSLAMNAREAMPNGGTLTISTRNVLLDAIVAAELIEIAPGPYIAITIEDTGAGMTPEVRARAVEPFFSTKDIGRGSGLGLSQVYGFVRQSDGQMRIKSEIGYGTSVTIYLPKSTTVKAEDTQIAPHAMAATREVVLVVEDEPDVLEMATAMVRNLGYGAVVAPNAAAALDILRCDRTVDVMFSDVLMPPGINGVELAHDACRLRPGLRVLLASGYPREALGDTLKYGITFIAKPYTMAALGTSLAGLSHDALR